MEKAHVQFFSPFFLPTISMFCSDIVFHYLLTPILWKNKIRHAHHFWWVCLFFYLNLSNTSYAISLAFVMLATSIYFALHAPSSTCAVISLAISKIVDSE